MFVRFESAIRWKWHGIRFPGGDKDGRQERKHERTPKKRVLDRIRPGRHQDAGHRVSIPPSVPSFASAAKPRGTKGPKAASPASSTRSTRRSPKPASIGRTLRGIGLGSAGPLDLDEGIILDAPNLGWKDVKIKVDPRKGIRLPGRRFSTTSTPEFTANIASGRLGRPAAPVGVFPGTGIGGGCVYDGKILRGKTNSCMEIGHIQVVPDGPLCGCGLQGCLESVASRLAISAAAAQAAYRGQAPHLLEIAGTDLDDIRSGALADCDCRGRYGRRIDRPHGGRTYRNGDGRRRASPCSRLRRVGGRTGRSHAAPDCQRGCGGRFEKSSSLRSSIRLQWCPPNWGTIRPPWGRPRGSASSASEPVDRKGVRSTKFLSDSEVPEHGFLGHEPQLRMSTVPRESRLGTTEPVRVVRPAAVIDIGTSSIRMAIAEIDSAGGVRTLETLSQAVNLGKDTFTKGSIEKATIEKCVEVLKSYRQRLREYQISRDDQIRVVATTAVREA